MSIVEEQFVLEEECDLKSNASLICKGKIKMVIDFKGFL